MAKSRELAILEPSSVVAFEGNSLPDIGLSAQSHRQQLQHQHYYQQHKRQHSPSAHLFVPQDDGSSYAFVLSDVQRSEASESLNHAKTPADQHVAFRSTFYDGRSYSYDACDSAPTYLPSRNTANFETDQHHAATLSAPGLSDYRGLYHRKNMPSDCPSNLIDFGSPPGSPCKLPAASQHATFQYLPGGKQSLLENANHSLDYFCKLSRRCCRFIASITS